VLELVPITRVHDATALDWLGVPVWCAVTPLAVDLTVHAGKGDTHPAARISATMEAIERVCAEQLPQADERVQRATFTHLSRQSPHVLDPGTFDLPFETSYAPDRPIDWVQGYDLIAGREVWVALDLVLSPAAEGVCIGAETNGLAAGNDLTEAVLHALYELIERDALAHDRFARLYADEAPPVRILEPASLPPPCAARVAELEQRGVGVRCQLLTHELGIPVVRATIRDMRFPGSEGRPVSFEGLGADLDPQWALNRAINEAAQSHTVLMIGARDTYEDGSKLDGMDTSAFLRRLLTPTEPAPFPATTDDLGDDLRDRLQRVLSRLQDCGLEHCIVVELTRPELGIPVVRVLAPGLSGPYGDTMRRPATRLLQTLR
jgi:ribosomal protein S12 methylthiotransferase accessory factor